MSKTRARFICFEGIDGSGKTSAATSLASALDEAGCPAVFVPRKEPVCKDSRLNGRLELLAELIWGYGELPIEKFGDHHAFFNMASWYSAIDSQRIRPTLDTGTTVVMDNWYFKFLARMMLKKGLDTTMLHSCFSHLTKPDLVFYLEIDAATAAHRKTHFNRGESGSFDGMGSPNASNFIRYQEMVANVLDRFSANNDWIKISTAEASLSDVVEACLQNVRARTI